MPSIWNKEALHGNLSSDDSLRLGCAEPPPSWREAASKRLPPRGSCRQRRLRESNVSPILSRCKKERKPSFSVPCSLFPITYYLFPIAFSLLPIPYSLFPTPYSLFPTPYFNGTSILSANQLSSLAATMEPPYLLTVRCMLFMPKPWKRLSRLVVTGMPSLKRTSSSQ